MTSTDIVAWSGLTLSILLALFEIWKYWNDKSKLKVTTRYNQQIMAMNAYGDFTDQETGKTFWSLDVANIGSKPIIITGISFKRSDIKKLSLLTKDYAGQINRYTLTPGDSHSYTIADELIPANKTIEALVQDATGKIHKQSLKYTN